MTEYANYVITAIGLLGFWLAGRKVWWCWYINIFNQVLWLSYGIATRQWGFVVGTVFYSIVFIKNAVSWTRGHFDMVPEADPKGCAEEDTVVDIWYYDAYLDRVFQHSLPEEKIQEFAELDLNRPWKNEPVYFFAHLSTEE